MAKIKEKEIFEYCEKLYKKFKNQDGGYYPSIHDELVFKETAKCFEISIEEVYKIFDTYTKLAAKIGVAKINRMPKAIRKEVTMKKLKGIVLENYDLPFHKLEQNNDDEKLLTAGEIIEEEYKDVISNVAKFGWTIPLNIELEKLEELKDISSNSEELDSFFIEFYYEKEFKNLCDSVLNKITNKGQKKRFEECFNMYLMEMYSSCITVLTTVLEGFISSFGDNPQDVRVMRICNYHAREEKDNGNNIQSLCWISMYEYTKILYEKSDFTQSEPNGANRHWIIHGRTSKLGERVDCLRLFNALSTMINIKGSKPRVN